MSKQILNKKTSVIILNWNGRKLLEKFLPAVVSHTVSDNCDVVIADNGSTDDSITYLKTNFPQVPLLQFDENYGFAGGYNKAINSVESEYVVLLNSDVETTPNWLQTLTDYMDANPDTAAVQPKILSYSDRNSFEYAGASGGFIDFYGYPFCRGRVLESLEEDAGQYDDTIPVFWATGACLCIRRKDFVEHGQLDDKFFAHMEEIDLCWRLNARGRRVACVPASVVYHIGGASLNKESSRKTYLNFRNNLLMLYKNTGGTKLKQIFAMRYLFDALACVHLLTKGKLSNAAAVIRAHRDFLKTMSHYRQTRKDNLAKTVVKKLPGQFDGNILINYYFRGRKTYSALLGKK